MFTLYANTVSLNVNVGTSNLYADDAIIYATGNTVNKTNEILSECLNDVNQQYSDNRFSENAYSMLIRSRRKHVNDCDFNVNIGNAEIQNVKTKKYL